MDYEVRRYSYAWNDVLRLRPDRQFRQEDVSAAIERDAEGLVDWDDRDPDTIAGMPWSWVLPQAKVFDVRLPDGPVWGSRTCDCSAWSSRRRR
jgi:hypothetical protein